MRGGSRSAQNQPPAHRPGGTDSQAFLEAYHAPPQRQNTADRRVRGSTSVDLEVRGRPGRDAFRKPRSPVQDAPASGPAAALGDQADGRPKTADTMFSSKTADTMFSSRQDDPDSPSLEFPVSEAAISSVQRKAKRAERREIQKREKMLDLDLNFALNFAVQNEQNIRRAIARVLNDVAAERAKQQQISSLLALQSQSLSRSSVISGRSFSPLRRYERIDFESGDDVVEARRAGGERGTWEVEDLRAVSASPSLIHQFQHSSAGADAWRVKRTARTAYSTRGTPTKTPAYLERWSKENSTSEKRRRRKEQRVAAERAESGVEAEMNPFGYVPEGGSFFDQRGDEGYRHGVGHKGMHGVIKERKPVLLHDCEEHIADGLDELNRKFASERSADTERMKDEMANDDGRKWDVNEQLKMQIERAKMFELPMRCIIANFKELGPLLKEIIDEYNATFAQFSDTRLRAIRQVVQESAGVDFEHREEHANYEHKIRILSERIAAWRKVVDKYKEQEEALLVEKIGIDKELEFETQKFFKKDSLMADVLTEKERLETEYESLKDVREVYDRLEQQFQEVDLERKAAIGRGADAEMRVSSLHQQIKSKQSEIQMIHQMEGLVKWRDRQMASGKGQRT